jgi:predicted metal-dependent enzyme (double-stranded beta helix superfamily)
MKSALICGLTLLATPVLAQETVALIDNPRVTVRDVALQPGKQGTVISHAGDYVVLYFQGGRIRSADGKTATHASGGAMFGHGGSTSDTALDKPAREIVVELKDAPSNTVPNTTGLPPAFPREGSKLILENDRVRVWNYTWLPGKPTPMHFHNTEVVVAYRGNGDVSSTTPDGKTTINHRKAGDIVFNLANRSHSEALVNGEQSGIMLELK